MSLIGYNSSDPPGSDYVASGEVRNPCGLIGACLSHYLFTAVGLAAYAPATLTLLWGVLLVTGRASGGVKLVVASTIVLVIALSSLFSPQLLRLAHLQNVISPGGQLGMVLAGGMVRLLAKPGALVVLAGITAIALYFSTNGLAFQALHRGGAATWTGLRALSRGTVRALGAIGRDAVDLVARHRRDRGEAAGDGTSPAPMASAVVEEEPAAAETVTVDQEPETHPEAGPVSPDQEREKTLARVADQLRRQNTERDKKKSAARSKSQGPGARTTSEGYELPSEDLLDLPLFVDDTRYKDFVQEQARKLEASLNDFGIVASVVGVQTGPVITQYEIALAPGIKVQRIHSLADDITMALKAQSVRIVAPIPGRSTVGIEVPNAEKSIVRLRELLGALQERARTPEIPILLGKDAAGAPLVHDLTEMPHLLIAGCTGSGKSVCLNSVVMSIMMTRSPDEVKLILIDPKMVELSSFAGIPHLMCPVVTDMKKAADVLAWAVRKMDERYILLSRAGVKHIRSYNKLPKEQLRRRLGIEEDEDDEEIDIPYRLPYVVVIVDELADLMFVAAKEVEEHVTRLAQKSRAVGIHVVLSTQRPSVDVITGLIKSNLPARISFQVSAKVDSRTILDRNGAEKLLGAGDMLFLPPATAKLTRGQGTYVSEEEIRRVMESASQGGGKPEYSEELTQSPGQSDVNPREEDELYDEAVRIIVESGRGSASLLQRALGVGYTRASRLVDLMYGAGIVGEYKGSVAREVLMSPEELHALQEAES